jgi:hypothetical protein
MMEALVVVAGTAFQGMTGPVMAALYRTTLPCGKQGSNRVVELRYDDADSAGAKAIVSITVNIASGRTAHCNLPLVRLIIAAAP